MSSIFDAIGGYPLSDNPGNYLTVPRGVSLYPGNPNPASANYILKTSFANLEAVQNYLTQIQILHTELFELNIAADISSLPDKPEGAGPEATDLFGIRTGATQGTAETGIAYSLTWAEILAAVDSSLSGNYATAAQGALANTAIQEAALTAALAPKANSADVYTKAVVDAAFALKADSSQVYTQGQIDTALGLKADQATTYTKAETDATIASLVDSAPSTLNTLNELAAALGDDPNFATTIAAQIGAKQDPATTLAGYGITDAYTETEVDAIIAALNLGTASQADTGDFATAAQGALADSALQNAAAFATAAQGAKADSAVQPNAMISTDADNGLSHGSDGLVYLDTSSLGGGGGGGASVSDTIGNSNPALAASSRRAGLLESAITTKANSADVYTSAATDAAIATAIADLLDSAPGTLDTLNELAAALGDDPNFATTVSTSLAGKLALAGGTMSGDIDMGNNEIRNVSLEDYQEKIDGLITSSTDFTISNDVNSLFRTLSASQTITLPNTDNMPTNTTRTVSVAIHQDGTGGHVPTFVAPAGMTLRWNDSASQPAANTTANKQTIYMFTYFKGSSYIYGSLAFYEG